MHVIVRQAIEVGILVDFIFFIIIIIIIWMENSTILKTRPDRPVRPVQPETGSQSGPVKTQKLVNNRSKTGKPVNNRAKTGVEPEIKKNSLMSGSVFKTMENSED